MPPRSSKRAAPEPEEELEPPFYTATENLLAGGPQAFPTLAFLAGDRVPPELVADNPQWGPSVEVPEQFKGTLAPPPEPPPPDEPGAEDQPTPE